MFFVVVLFSFLNLILIVHYPLQEIWVTLPGWGTAAPRVAPPIPTSVCRIFVSKHWDGCRCLGFVTCTYMFMYAIAHGGCTTTTRESALKVDSKRKIPCCTGESNLHQYCAGLFGPMCWAILPLLERSTDNQVDECNLSPWNDAPVSRYQWT